MGVYIPNMDKPKSCWECRLMDGEANCLVTDEGIPFKQEGIYPDCPLIDIVTCGECKHRPIKDDPDGEDYGFNIVAPTDGDELCPCLVEDGWYSWMPEDNFYCGRGERRSDEPNT